MIGEAERGDLLEAYRDYMHHLEQSEAARVVYVARMQALREAGATNQEIGDVLGVTRQRVSQLLKERNER